MSVTPDIRGFTATGQPDPLTAHSVTPGVSSPSARVFAIDMARGAAVLFMIAVHTLWMFGTREAQVESGFGQWVHIAGQGACAFLITMGFSFMVVRDRSLGRALRRGVVILLVAYGLNTLKFIVPIYVFGTMPEAFIEAYGWRSPLTLNQALYLVATGDILPMAGISFVLIGLVRHWVSNKYGVLALAFVAVGFSALVRGTRIGHPVADYCLDLLWGTEWNVYFPVFPWIANILVGMFLGMHYLEKGRDEQALFRAAGILGPILLIGGGAITLTDWAYHFNDFFHTGPGGAVYLIGAGLCVFYLGARFVATPFRDRQWFRVSLTYLSAHVTTLYVVQWTLICWFMGLIGYQTLGVWQVVGMMPVMVVATLGVEWMLRRAVGQLRRQQLSA
ncbi:MAG: heparan-alpha-glucosaminide N-acetyltransferase domain-containing protein [Pseudomonadota bacterium]|nr:heparan-alpha-glucosaminide N-acetyltransferase domain-containing protein [Pseudomonadota bacterium]